MILTVFRSRLRPDIDRAAYDRLAGEVFARGTSMPGFVSHKSFTAEDGERLTLVAFESMEHQKAWAREQLHREAQRDGRRLYYAEYSISICEELDRRDFQSPS